MYMYVSKTSVLYCVILYLFYPTRWNDNIRSSLANIYIYMYTILTQLNKAKIKSQNINILHVRYKTEQIKLANYKC